jgi:hypothetical protein
LIRPSPSIATGQSILATNAGKSFKVYSNLQRSYKFALTFTPALHAAAPDASELVVNGSFETTSPKPTTWLDWILQLPRIRCRRQDPIQAVLSHRPAHHAG